MTAARTKVIYEHGPEVVVHRAGCPADRLEVAVHTLRPSGAVERFTTCQDCGRQGREAVQTEGAEKS